MEERLQEVQDVTLGVGRCQEDKILSSKEQQSFGLSAFFMALGTHATFS
jgi:hypothetical protein